MPMKSLSPASQKLALLMEASSSGAFEEPHLRPIGCSQGDGDHVRHHHFKLVIAAHNSDKFLVQSLLNESADAQSQPGVGPSCLRSVPGP